jgi:hypothetical protein
MRAHIRSSMANAMRRLEPYFRLEKQYTGTYSRTLKVAGEQRTPFQPRAQAVSGALGKPGESACFPHL